MDSQRYIYHMKRAFILDLDNTIYPVPPMADGLFSPLFELIAASGIKEQELSSIKRDIVRKPFQLIALQYGLGQNVTERGVEFLKTIRYEGRINSFHDYDVLKNILCC
jgi:putative hydrolase of the HAD superfamily